MPAPGAAGHNGAMRNPADLTLPGIPNLHSHAFQRAMAGLAEHRTHPQDSFWTWRELMYRFAARMDPDSTHAVASQLYAEMLEAGYTTVCEFHYLHHQPDGRPYADPAAMSRALVAAARDTGIRLTLLPVLYMSGGFAGEPLSPRQQRFAHDVDGFLRLLDGLRPLQDDTLRIGCAFHSLRAVPEQAMQKVLQALPADAPVHLHIAEQVPEVEASLAVRGERPVQWLLRRFPVDARWTLVHATHLDADEVGGIAASGATVAICPTTEANLGDGVFPLRDYLDAGGRWGIGSDSHVSVSPVEELRWLEYGQRLASLRRNVAARVDEPRVGRALLAGVAASAASATGFADTSGDGLELDAEAPQLAGASAGDLAERWLFAGNRPLVRQVRVAGEVRVRGGRHVGGEAIAARYRATLARLLLD